MLWRAKKSRASRLGFFVVGDGTAHWAMKPVTLSFQDAQSIGVDFVCTHL